MRKSHKAGWVAVACAALLLLAPAMAQARAGGGASFGSRGSRTFTPPARTSISPFAAPIGGSDMPRPSYGSGVGYGADYPPPRRTPFMAGFMGGLIGAGIGGLLLGGGFFGGLFSLAALLGFVVQIVLLILVVRVVIGLFARRVATPRAPVEAAPAPQRGPPVALQRADYAAFEQVLRGVQAAWTEADPNRMRPLTTPEMLRRFGEQIADLRRHGWRNEVRDVQLEKGELGEAWLDADGREYASVAMRFSMIDVTRDARGYVVDGSPDERVLVNELWTFARPPGGSWVLSAIQQA